MTQEAEKNKVQEENNGEEETLNFNKPDFQFIPKGSHQWRQHGPYVICKSCELEHAVWVGMEQIMVGLSETGEPILKPKVTT